MADPVYDFLNSAAPAGQPEAKSDAVYEFLNSGGKAEPVKVAKAKDYSPDNTTMPEVAGHVLSGMGSTIIGGWHGLAILATGGTLDDAANSVREEQEKRTYQPQGEEAKKVVEGIGSPANPMNWPGIVAKKAGEFAQDLGASPAVATAIETAGNVAGPAVAGKALKLVPGRAALPEPVARIEPTLSAGQDVTQPIVKALRQEPTAPPLELAPDTGRPRAEPIPAARESAPPPTVAPAAGATRDRFTTAAEAGEEPPQFLQGPPESGAGPAYNARAAILKRVGLTEARESALSGDGQSAATDYQTSKLDSPVGRHMRAALDTEKGALTGYSEGLVRDTGGTMGTDTSTLYSRGDTILRPLDSLNDYFNKQVKALYKEADTRAGGQPVNLPKTHEFVGGDQAEFLGTTEGESLLKGVKARMRSLGMFDDEGAPKPVTIMQAEQLKQYLNNQWQPRTSRLISGLKNSIDDDVTANAGEDIYAKARAMRAMKASVFENDLTDAQGRTIGNGISKIVDANGRNIELLKDTEKVADVVTSLPSDQLAQIVKTLKHLPPELADQGAAALAEIKAQFANKIHETGTSQAGQWAAKNVSGYLNKNAARLQEVFSPEEMAKFNDLNDAGHILAKDQSYPGAAVQEHNLVQRGAMHALRTGSAAVGGAIAGGPGAAVGGFLGDKMAGRFGEAAALKAAQKRIVNLSNVPE